MCRRRLGIWMRGLWRLPAPLQCPSCRRRLSGDGPICRACARRLGPSGPRPLRARLRLSSGVNRNLIEGLRLRPGDLRVRSLGPLQGVWGRAVRAYKEDPARPLAGWMESMLAERLDQDLGRASAGFEGLPLLVPVPMASTRRRQRGFNPPEVLARRAACRLDWPSEPKLLRRVRYRRPLRGLSAAERREEIRGAFGLGTAGASVGLRVRESRGIVLIDDVFTTGATLRGAAEVLLKAGLPVIGAWTLARTPRRSRRRGRADFPREGTRENTYNGGVAPPRTEHVS